MPLLQKDTKPADIARGGGATTFAGYIIQVGQDSLFLSLVLTMLTCLVLGMGIPTIPNYIITSSIAAPALLDLGVPLIVSHMFVFYFGIMADLTPPVALAAFAAAPIAKESGLKIGVRAVQIAIAALLSGRSRRTPGSETGSIHSPLSDRRPPVARGSSVRSRRHALHERTSASRSN